MPRHFSWCRTVPTKLCFFTDYCLDSAPTVQAEKKIAWLLEPPAIYSTGYNYVQTHLAQFDHVLTYDRTLVDGNKILFYPHGGCWIPDVGDQRNRPYLVGIHKKQHLVSIIASNKAQTVGHQLRHKIIRRYAQLAAFGPQYRTIEYKEDALIDFMFSIVVENSDCNDYFTEKLIDCFAVGTIPIYWGTKNLGCYFDIDGVLAFDNLDELDQIMAMLSPELYNERLRHVQNNFSRYAQYRVPEDWIFEHYPHLFST